MAEGPPQRARGGNHVGEGPVALQRRLDLGGDLGRHAAHRHVAYGSAVGGMDSDHHVPGGDQVARGATEAGMQLFRVMFAGELQADLEQGRHAGCLAAQFGGHGDELVVDHLKVLLVELLRWRPGARRPARQHLIDRLEHHVGIGRLGQDAGNTAGLGEVARLALVVGGSEENDGDFGRQWLLTHAAHQLVAVHGRHQDVGHHQVDGRLRQYGERFGAVRRLKHAMTAIGEQRHQEVTICRTIVDGEDHGHGSRPLGAGGPARWPGKWTSQAIKSGFRSPASAAPFTPLSV